MNLIKAQNVVYVYNEIEWLNNAIKRINEVGISNYEEYLYRKDAIKSLQQVMKIKVEQLNKM